MRVVLLVTDLDLGGTPLRLARMARALRTEGVDVTVGCLSSRGPVSAELERDGVSTFACGARRAWHLAALWRLRAQLKQIRPHILHSTLMHANVAARFVGTTLRIPVVTSTATIEIQRRWHRLIERSTAWLDSGHIVNSGPLAEHVMRSLGYARDRVHLIPAAVKAIAPVDRSAARKSLGLADQVVVLWVGRLDPVKRVDVLLDCAARMRDRNILFLIVGDGPGFSSLSARIEREKLQAIVRMEAWQGALAPYYAAADLFVFPSITEGMPNALMEAMSAGVPVIAREIPAYAEISGGGDRVELVRASSQAVEAAVFVDAINRLLADASRRAQLAMRGREWASEHNDDKTAKALIAIYETILKQHTAR